MELAEEFRIKKKYVFSFQAVLFLHYPVQQGEFPLFWEMTRRERRSSIPMTEVLSLETSRYEL